VVNKQKEVKNKPTPEENGRDDIKGFFLSRNVFEGLALGETTRKSPLVANHLVLRAT